MVVASFLGEGAKGRKFLEVEIVLHASDKLKPLVKGVKVQYGTKFKE